MSISITKLAYGIIQELPQQRNYIKKQSLKIIESISRESIERTGLVNCWVTIPSSYWRKRVNSDYRVAVDWLIANGLILVDESYNTLKGLSKGYRLGGVVFKSDIDGQEEALRTSVLLDALMSPKQKNPSYINLTMRDLSLLKFDPVLLDKATRDYVENSTLPWVETSEYEPSDFGWFYSSVEMPYKALVVEEVNRLRSEGYEVFRRKSGFVFGDREELLNHRKLAIGLNCHSCITGLLGKHFYAKRNDTNRRLDTNITNLPNPLFKEVLKKNELAQLDLRNSQFAILASTLPNTKEFETFKRLTHNGELYSFIEKNLPENFTVSGKSVMFAVMFGRIGSRARGVKIVKKLFPELIEWVDNEKKRLGGYEKFSVELQKKESKIFIDEILKGVKKTGRFCLTKHDSLIVRKKDLNYAIKTVTTALKRNKISGELRVEQFKEEVFSQSFVSV